MKLSELEPRWFDVPERGKSIDGVSFLCPCCQKARLAIQFTPMSKEDIHHRSHQEGDPHTIVPLEGLVWNRQGDTFDSLTLTPSIDSSISGHWHGFITNGEIC